MKKRYIFQIMCMVSAGILFGSPGSAALKAEQAHTIVEMVPQHTHIQPGHSLQIGFFLKTDDEWHTYWRNPGDSGFPTDIRWTLPPGYTVSETQWPYPQRLEMPPLTTYGYEKKTFLLHDITVPPDVPIGSQAKIRAKVNWLACRVECIPGSAVFDLILPVAKSFELNPSFTALYDEFKDRYPKRVGEWDPDAFETDQRIIIEIPKTHFPQPIVSMEYFAQERGTIDHAAQQTFNDRSGKYRLTVKKDPRYINTTIGHIKGVVVLTKAGEVSEKESFKVEAKTRFLSESPPASGKTSDPLWLAIVFAFAGGLILNVMPCVLPVLSIKVLNLVEAANKNRHRAFVNGLLFAAGILVSFWFLAFFIIALKSAGQQVGWGFQFQSPVFLVFMSVLFFWLGLNLFGIFELGTSLSQFENTFKHSFLLKNSFANGILATIVATPCTAPFMGSAMGYALFKPPIYSYVIFTFLGLGLASPYLILAVFPALLRFVPKPGPWMLVLKKLFGFLFMATVVWLGWVLGAQKGAGALSHLYGGLLIIAISAWVIGQWAGPHKRKTTRWAARLIAIVIFAAGCAVALKATTLETTVSEKKVSSSAIDWHPYSQARIDQWRAQHKAILIDFTAKWCLSCQVNERVALSHPDVVKMIREKDIIAVKADWTNYDEEITRALAAYGKNSIPVYVLYSPGAKEPVFLPEILTPKIVLKALEKI